jgi:hypothetical protein
MNLEMLLRDVEALKTRFRLDVEGKSAGRLVLKYVPELALIESWSTRHIF